MPEMTPLEERLTKEVEALRQENKLLREKIDLLVRRVFGASSEKMDTDQLLLALEGMESKKPEADSSAADALAADSEPKRQVKPRKKKGSVTRQIILTMQRRLTSGGWQIWLGATGEMAIDEWCVFLFACLLKAFFAFQ